jgi:protein ImuA
MAMTRRLTLTACFGIYENITGTKVVAVPRPDPDRTLLVELRSRVAALEGRLSSGAQLPPDPASAANGQGPARLLTGVAGFDGLFASSGMPCGTLHEATSAESRSGGALTGFAAAMLSCFAARRAGAVLWVTEPDGGRETGSPNAEGLARFGLDPARVVLVRARCVEEMLWAVEEGVQAKGVCAVVAEMRGAPRALDLTASRRLLLRAEAGGATAFLLRHAGGAAPTAAVTRFRIAARPSGGREGLRLAPLGRPGWRVELQRNRDGRPGTVELEWDHAMRSFAAPADREPVVPRTGDRPAGAPGTGGVVAFARR